MTRCRRSRWACLFLLLTFPGCGMVCEGDPPLEEPPAAPVAPPEACRDPKSSVEPAPVPAISPGAAPPGGVAIPLDPRRAAEGVPTAPAPSAVPFKEGPRRVPAPGAAAGAAPGAEGDDDTSLAGEEVVEQSEIETLLFTGYRKRRSAHFFFETSFDADACKETIAFCEKSYLDFLQWAGKPPETDLWGMRAHIALLHNKAEWECLLMRRTQGMPPHIVEGFKNVGAQWEASPPAAFLYSREGSDRGADKVHLFHFLNHLFLHGLAGSGSDGTVWWLWEAFSWHRSIEVFGARGGTCRSFDTDGDGREDRAWFDIDDWVDLLKRDVRAKQDEDFLLFWHKDLMNIQSKTCVKAWSMIRWFTRDEKERAKLVDFVSMIKTKNDQARALKEVYDMNPGDLDKAWREWIRGQPNRWRPRR
jgi:hypothetical protein